MALISDWSLRTGTISNTPNSISRKRYKTLVDLAVNTAELLDKKGLKRDEYCTFGKIMENIIERS